MILALDLEGTLISNAVSQFPRNGLFEFLTWCNSKFSRIVLFTAVRKELARSIIEDLAMRGDAPNWFAHIEIIEWIGKKKDLSFIKECSINQVVIVDDQEIYIVEEQKSQWIPIPEYSRPFSNKDNDLKQVIIQILKKFPCLDFSEISL